MRIGFDARFYGAEIGRGLGRYLENLLKELQEIDKDNDYFIFLKKENFDLLKITNPRFKKVLADYPWYSFKEQIFMPFKIWRAKIDLMHFPHFNAPIFSFCPFILTLHDLIHLSHPRATTRSNFFYQLKFFCFVFILKISCRRARKIIAVSHFTKKEMVRLLKISPEKISVIYEGIHEFQEGDDKDVLKRYNIASPYIFYLGSFYPHKNIEKILHGFKELKKNFPDLTLVLAGRLDAFFEKIKNKAQELGLYEEEKERGICFTGFIKDGEVSSLMKKAEFYLSPSLIEGFGFPPLEAQVIGTPVLSSRTLIFEEILGDSALYFDPNEERDFVEKATKLLSDKELKSSLIKKGKENIGRFSWIENAQETLSLYHEELK